MAQIDVRGREINAKIVYYGPSQSGKTTNLANIHTRLPAATRGEMKSIATEFERTLFFDFVPIEPVRVGGWNVRFHLYSVPGQDVYVRTRRAILGGADGIVFVADVDAGRTAANVSSMAELAEHLAYWQQPVSATPCVVQYNKADLPNAVAMEDLEPGLNTHGWPSVLSCAVNGAGVTETLATISKLVARSL